MTYPFYPQLDAMDCGAACLRMIAKYYDKSYSLEYLREQTYITREGVSLLGIGEAAEKLGFRTMGVHLTFEKLADEVPLPCIAHWKQEHFVVVYDIQKKRKPEEYKITVADSAHGIVVYKKEEFLTAWLSRKDKQGNENEGIVLGFERGQEFYNIDDQKQDRTKLSCLFQQ